MFERFFEKFSHAHWRLVECTLLAGIAFDKVLDFSKDHFHKYCLGTGPAAKDAAESHSEQDDKDDHGNGQKDKEMKILRKKTESKNDEFSIEEVQLQQRPAVYSNEWADKKDS